MQCIVSAEELPPDLAPDAKWKRFRRTQLGEGERGRLEAQLEAQEAVLKEDVAFELGQWRCFTDRVAREYKWLHAKHHASDTMHLHRETVLQSAINTIRVQLKPRMVRPYDGDQEKIIATVQPMVENTLDLPGPNASTEDTMKSKIASKSYTIRECHKHTLLMNDYVSRKIKESYAAGDKTGALVLRTDEVVPGPETLYTLSCTRVGRRRATVGDTRHNTDKHGH